MSERKIIQNKYLKAEVSTHGAELKGLKDIKTNVDYIWSSDPKFWGRSAPFLFPIVGTLKDKKTIFNGKTYDMKQHGLLRDQEFSVVEVKEDEITLVNEYNEETLKMYPFKYKAYVTYKLVEKVLQTKVEIVNIGKEVMPFTFGGHPAFMCPIYENESFTDYSVHFEEKETFKSPKVMPNATLNFDEPVFERENLEVLNLDKSLFDIDTIIITNVKSKSVKLLNKENKGIKFSYPGFKTLAIWTPYNEAPFVCLEPWNGYNDRHDTNGDFLTKDDVMTLEENKKYVATYDIEIL